MIGSILQELIEEVTIGPMDFDAVKASLFRVVSSFAEGLNDARNFGGLERARRHICSHRTHQAHVAGRPDRAGSNRKSTLQKAWV